MSDITYENDKEITHLNSNLNDDNTGENKEQELKDIYKVDLEMRYHNVKKFKSAGVLENEKSVLEEIIEYKKKDNIECFEFENKMSIMDLEIANIQTAIICENLSLDQYKENIKIQLSYEEKLIETLNEDTLISNEEKKIILARIKKRIEIINMELAEQFEEENNEDKKKKEDVIDLNGLNDKFDQSENENKISEVIKNEKSNSESKEEIVGINRSELKNDHNDLSQKKQGFIDKKLLNEEENDKKSTKNIKSQISLKEEKDKEPKMTPYPKTEIKILTNSENLFQNNDQEMVQNKKLITNEESNIMFEKKNSIKNDRIIFIVNNTPNLHNENLSESMHKNLFRQNSIQTVSELLDRESIIYDKKLTEEEIIKNLKDNVIYQNLKVRLNEYKYAIEYFRENFSAKQENDAIMKASLSQKLIRALEHGQEIDESKIPIGINPDYINDCSKKQRCDNYTKLIRELNKNKSDLQNKKNIILKEFNSLQKKDQLKRQDETKKKIVDLDKQIKVFEIQVKKFMGDFKNQWIPCPQYAFFEEEEKKEKIMLDIAENTIQIHLESCDYDKFDAYIKVTLDHGNGRKQEEWVYISQFPKTLLWPIDKNDLLTIYKKKLEINIYRTHWYWPFQYSLKGSIKIKLESLRNNCLISDKFLMNLISKRRDVIFNLSIGLRTPIQEKEYYSVFHPKISLTKIFSEFKIPKVDFNEEINSSKKEEFSKEKIKIENESKKLINKEESSEEKKNIHYDKKENGQNQKKIEEKKDQNQKEEITDIPLNQSDFTKEELDDPDILENLVSIKVMEFKIQNLDLAIKKIEGRTPADLRRKFLNLKVRYNKLKECIVEGDLSINDYILILQKQIDKDKKLLQFFKLQKDQKKCVCVSERCNIMIKELKEAIDHLKK